MKATTNEAQPYAPLRSYAPGRHARHFDAIHAEYPAKQRQHRAPFLTTRHLQRLEATRMRAQPGQYRHLHHPLLENSANYRGTELRPTTMLFFK
ncbi:hypothetical protein [Ralstonia insidiosa]|uniref:Uncharacterized protein n=1 Tax=Ralstonia insidiosa TaxID=190721 RepID=A0A848NT78_9RALS|nr:hypothetical protein [Ralstonia insidiosa]NMV36337.1 hypothetical protein [Ralstonia insidiosa]